MACYITKSCEASLKRLNIETIDLFYLHRFNPEVAIEDSMGAMLRLIKEGKILYVGLSEVDDETLERAHRVLGNKLVALQTEYSIANHTVANSVLPTCRKLGVGFVAYSPLGRGLLSGSLKTRRLLKKVLNLTFGLFCRNFKQMFTKKIFSWSKLLPLLPRKKIVRLPNYP